MTGGGALTQIDLPLPRRSSGKVREIFDLDADRLLIVATDRISAFDVAMAQGIPGKGRILTQMTLFWLPLASGVCPTHFVSASVDSLDGSLGSFLDELRGRSMIVRRLDMLAVEFVVRGYLAGSGWKDYAATGTVCGVPLPPGLREADRLPEPIFTPATKATDGHDLNISEDEAAEMCGPDILKGAKGFALELYRTAAEYAAGRGIILADTKFEFGIVDGRVTLGDEILTPDSSRLWPADSWAPGSSPPSFDKQFLRDWLDGCGWDHDPPPPDLPAEVVEQTRARYVEAYERLVGRRFEGGG